MRLSLEALSILDAIERKGSFAAAAQALHRVPSAVTYAVQKLEQDLGVRLFDRSGHRAVPTEAGAELLREGRHLLRAAQELEARVKRVATGFETELRIALSDMIPAARFYPLAAAFYREGCGTRLRLSAEVYGGSWDALVSGRADLALGAPGEAPPGGGYASLAMGVAQFVFAVAPSHPLAAYPEPLSAQDILQFRAVSAADSSRNLPPRTSGLLSGQDVFTVPDMLAKIEAQRAGLGVGYVPRHLAGPDLASGRLVPKTVEEPKPDTPLFAAWRTGHAGRALQWFLESFRRAGTLSGLLAEG